MGSQLSMFEEEKVFKHKSRGRILTDKIWHQLSIHQKINLRVVYKAFEPNYWCIENAFEQGLDKSPFAIKRDYLPCYASNSKRKFKNL